MNKRRPTSTIWNYFKRLNSNIAKCNLCKKQLSCKTTISNLNKHLLKTHKVKLHFGTTKTLTKLDEQIDLKELITLVKQHPCLWDIQCAFFGNSEKKIESWNSIASILCPKLETSLAVTKLTERFGSLRELFFDDKVRAENNSNAKTSIYYDDLQFLDSSHASINISSDSSVEEETKQTHMNVFEMNEVDVKNEPLVESDNGEEYRKLLGTVNANRVEDNDDPLSDVSLKEKKRFKAKREQMMPQCTLQLNHADKDILFLLSLADEMRRVPMDKKMSFKSELMMTLSSLVQKYKQGDGESNMGGDD